MTSSAVRSDSSASERASDARVKTTADSLAGGEDLTKVVAAVFGADSTGVRLMPAADVEPVWDMDVRSYEAHERVAHYINLFSGSAKERFQARLSRGARYEPMIRAKLREGGLPEDMTYLALVESGYDPHAYSKAAAVGMWQFMSSTARDVGMRVDWWVDERRDPAKATDGAIRFLRDLQNQFGGSLYLAAAAYNGGPGRVSRGLTRFADEMEGSEGEDRFFALAEQDYLRSETKDYVPQLIAAAIVAKMPAKYGISVEPAAPYEYDSVRVEPGTSLAALSAASGATAAEVRDLNPALLRGVSPPDLAYWMKVPAGRAESTRAALDAMPESSRRGFTVRTVSGTGTTPAAFALAAGTTVKALAAFNPGLKTTRKGRLVAGQTLRVPSEEALAFARDVPNPSIEIYGSSSTRTLARAGYHVVKKGESLGSIAKRYGISTARLKSLNGIKGTRAVAGQTLRVRGTVARPETRSTKAVASRSTSSANTASRSSSKASAARKANAPKSTAKKPTIRKSSAGSSTKSAAKSSGRTASKSSAKSSTAKSSTAKASTAKKAPAKKSTSKAGSKKR